ncbi:2-dehydro-3-deoxygalactonokinase [Reichenbachiella sp.]|uniref:2-dehydro-3-deoxygalactonokinase n=1 Tax=Reichenbachiella sp. TaxID=2184521 RepID=UPI003BAF33C3
MSNQSQFISCDWGTTNFRLRLVDRNSLEILKEHKSTHGVKWLNNEAKRIGKAQEQVFFDFITEQLSTSFPDWENVPMVCSGMLSSTLGLKELPYAKMPLKTSGKDLITESIPLPNRKEILLISGARGATGFMRGEEVQAIGLADDLTEDGILILPGTHAKHLDFVGDQFTEMKNFMTGELFSVLADHSILENSIRPSVWADNYQVSFLDGVKLGLQDGCATHLLSVRSKQMFESQAPQEGYFYLSGLLIGDELSYLKGKSDHIYLAAGEATFPLYKLALESFLDREQLTFFENATLRKSLFRGQRKILDIHGN